MNAPSIDAAVRKALENHILQAPDAGIQYPVHLTAKSPFAPGVAALIFAGANFLSPADDIAEFGYPNPDHEEANEQKLWFYPPYDAARIIAWFRPPEAGRKYNLDFSADVGPHLVTIEVGPLVLESSDGDTETVAIDPFPTNAQYPTKTQEISSTFSADTREWRWFALSCASYWRFSYCELNVLP